MKPKSADPVTVPQGRKTGPIGLGWPQIGFTFGFNTIMYLITLNEPYMNPISGRVGPPGPRIQIWAESGRVDRDH